MHHTYLSESIETRFVLAGDAYRKYLLELAAQRVVSLVDILEGRFSVRITRAQLETIDDWLEKFGYEDVQEALDEFCDRDDVRPCERAFAEIPRIIAVIRKFRKLPKVRKLEYIQAILRNKIGLADFSCLPALEAFQQAGISLETQRRLASRATSWGHFKAHVGRAQEESNHHPAVEFFDDANQSC